MLLKGFASTKPAQWLPYIPRETFHWKAGSFQQGCSACSAKRLPELEPEPLLIHLPALVLALPTTPTLLR